MKWTSMPTMPIFYDRYIRLVSPERTLMDSLTSTIGFADEATLEKAFSLGDRVYAEGKWTFKEILQHIIDNERIQTYRALRISRGDQTALPGYDENLLASAVDVSLKSTERFIEEFKIVRSATILLFEGITADQLVLEGVCSGIQASVASLGFMVVGHQIHHLNVLRERYFPLLQESN